MANNDSAEPEIAEQPEEPEIAEQPEESIDNISEKSGGGEDEKKESDGKPPEKKMSVKGRLKKVFKMRGPSKKVVGSGNNIDKPKMRTVRVTIQNGSTLTLKKADFGLKEGTVVSKEPDQTSIGAKGQAGITLEQESAIDNVECFLVYEVVTVSESSQAAFVYVHVKWATDCKQVECKVGFLDAWKPGEGDSAAAAKLQEKVKMDKRTLKISRGTKQKSTSAEVSIKLK